MCQIYIAKANAIILWACIQREGKWVGGDPNLGCAFKVSEQGYHVEPGYYYFKQVCRAGQPGMPVARVLSNDSLIGLIALAHNGTDNPDAFVALNTAEDVRYLPAQIWGSESGAFQAYRTSGGEAYVSLGEFAVRDGVLAYDAPPRSVTIFYAR